MKRLILIALLLTVTLDALPQRAARAQTNLFTTCQGVAIAPAARAAYAGQPVGFLASAQCPQAPQLVFAWYLDGALYAVVSTPNQLAPLTVNTAGWAPGSHSLLVTVQRSDTGAGATGLPAVFVLSLCPYPANTCAAIGAG